MVKSGWQRANMFERIIHGDSRVKDDGERKYPSDLDLSKTRTGIPRVNNSVQQKTGANRGVSFWTNTVFEWIGTKCGGLLEVDSRTRSFINLFEARLKVKSIGNGFLWTTIDAQVEGVSLLRLKALTKPMEDGGSPKNGVFNRCIYSKDRERRSKGLKLTYHETGVTEVRSRRWIAFKWMMAMEEAKRRKGQPIIREDLSIEKAQLGLNDIVDRSCRDFQSFNAVAEDLLEIILASEKMVQDLEEGRFDTHEVLQALEEYGSSESSDSQTEGDSMEDEQVDQDWVLNNLFNADCTTDGEDIE
ncbi:hypothetical protein LOK49_LG10G01106 [Camellia lanceoleosa]|uniref:Uncharacterized protein n=1 Tax=Camellia lanceoleosa TaxID=1840588 RepID=A0ACC0GD20_9ERIC|nr:hypothetical protein LOK49_LG10G01106 [Camellia lanceoleosa]